MTYDDFQNASTDDLKRQANECFRLAYDTGPADRPAHLLEAQFYIGEIERREQERERRKHDRIALRDLILEIVVILLIGGEIVLAIKQGSDEDILMDKQNAVLTDMNKNASATAEALKALEAATFAQHDLDYRVALSVVPDRGVNGVGMMNLGQRRVGVLGWKIEGSKTNWKDTNRVELLTGQSVQLIMPELYDVTKKVGNGGVNNAGKSAAIPFEFYLRGDDGSEWVAKYRFVGVVGSNGGIDIKVDRLSVTKEQWPHRP